MSDQKTGTAVYPLLAQGVFGTYGYFIVDEATGHALLVDPGARPALFEEAARENGWIVEKILLTHGHFDHFGAADELRHGWNAPIFASRKSPAYLEDTYLNLSASHGYDMTLSGTQPLDDGDIISLDGAPNVRLRAMSVPGHTEDSLVYVLDGGDMAFVGDVVYEGGPGLTVFPTGNAAELATSIRKKVLTLPPTTTLLSGHSDPITVAQLARRMGA